MRLPNGYGSVTKLSGKRRNPYRVRITTGWEPNEKTKSGKQLYLTIGYAKSRAEGLAMLAEYHKNPYTIEASTVTFNELYEKYSAEKFAKAGKSTILGYTAAYKLSSSLYDLKFIDIRKAHMQAVIDNCERGHGTRKKIKVLFNQLYKYAMENDITNKDYSVYVDIGPNDSESKRKPFSQDEIDLLFKNEERLEFIDTVLIMIYTGLRISELLELETKNVDLQERIMRGGMKTEAGKNRVIPINKKILPYIERRMAEGNEYLISNHKQAQMSYWTYTGVHWNRIMGQLEMEHLPHDCRHTFATLMDNAGANKLSIKRIIGHASKDITDKVYTHKDISELKKAIDLI